jgi:hypothetical protein
VCRHWGYRAAVSHIHKRYYGPSIVSLKQSVMQVLVLGASHRRIVSYVVNYIVTYIVSYIVII